VAQVDAIAHRYADALFQAALSKKGIESVLSDCQLLRQVFESDETLFKIIQNPLIPEKLYNNIFLEIKNRSDFHQVTENFMRVVIKNHRQPLFLHILHHFEKKVKAYQGIKDAYVTSARPLNQVQRDRLHQVLEKRTKAKIFLHEKIDATIMGGLIIRIDSFEIDSSLRTKLQCIQQSLESLK